MRYEVLFSLLMIGLLLIVLVVIAAWGSCMQEQKKSDYTAILRRVLSIIISCNTYPKMLTVFTRLEHNVKKHGIEIQDQFGGIFSRMRKRESKHFAKLRREIELAIECAASECGDECRASCGLTFVKTDQLKGAVEREYRQFRDDLKKECYGRNEEGRPMDATEEGRESDGGRENGQSLDARKIAAVICYALIRKKPLVFDEKKAVELLAEQEELLNQQKNPDRTVLNKWIVDNFLSTTKSLT